MIDVEPKDLSIPETHRFLLGGIAPRPIALVSTVSLDGVRNLAPFSFFNAFGANPPTVAFSPARRGRDGSVKDTCNNLLATKECVIQAVTDEIVYRVNLASTEYDDSVDEFVKSGLTPVPSDLVKPFRVEESPFQMECQLKQMVELGGQPASGNLAICEVVKFHVHESILTDHEVDPRKIRLVGRNGRNFYTNAFGDALFELPKPSGKANIGYDAIPKFIVASSVLTARQVGQLAQWPAMPAEDDAAAFVREAKPFQYDREAWEAAVRRKDIEAMFGMTVALLEENRSDARACLETTVASALEKDQTEQAWLMICGISQLRPEEFPAA